MQPPADAVTPPEIPRITIAAPRRPGGPWTVLPNHAVETVIGQRGVVTAKNQRAAWIIAEDLARQFAATIPPPNVDMCRDRGYSVCRGDAPP